MILALEKAGLEPRTQNREEEAKPQCWLSELFRPI